MLWFTRRVQRACLNATTALVALGAGLAGGTLCAAGAPAMPPPAVSHAVASGVNGIAPRDTPPAKAKDDANQATLKVGESYTFANGPKITFVQVVSDSRCPANADCFAAGQAMVSLRTELHKLTIVGNTAVPGAFDTQNCHIAVQTLEPHPVAGHATNPKDYRLVVQVTERDAASPGPADGPNLVRPERGLSGHDLAPLADGNAPNTSTAGKDVKLGAWVTVCADEKWYLDQAAAEQVFTGRLEAVPDAEKPSTLMRTTYYKLGVHTIYTAGKRVPALDKLVGKDVDIRGKEYDISLEGQALREIWPGAVRTRN